MTEKEFINEILNLDIILNSNQLNQLEKYYELLVEWNQKINLTAIIEKEQVYLKHFYDSLTLNKVIDLDQELTLVDVGTGAGFPGIVLKIAFPKLKITLLDSLNKRIEFLKLVIKELDLKDIEAIHARSEDYAKENREKYDLATARAVAPLNILLEYIVPMLKEGGFFLPMKANISQEIIESKTALKILNSEIITNQEFKLPKEESIRTILKIRKSAKTNNKYPRKFSEIKKRPL
ncbi:MAG: 16S rRNA (guanine(527)-N(7))-methyltransferase RsmG [Firmicutes bacterium]|nr:16S rRNA (guanine(527)-N(7))-methyltransferase RsmG [Bacillota bacterium]